MTNIFLFIAAAGIGALIMWGAIESDEKGAEQ